MPSESGAAQVPPVLTVARAQSGVYILRIHDLADSALAVHIAKGLTDATSLIVITPTDTKLFRMDTADAGGRGAGLNVRRSSLGPLPSAPEDDEDHPVDTGTDAEDVPDPMEEAMRLAAADEAESDGGVMSPPPAKAAPKKPAKVVRPTAGAKVVKRDASKNAAVAGHQSPCGRCQGTGLRQILLEGGRAGTAPCGVCQGKGFIRRYGSSPTSR